MDDKIALYLFAFTKTDLIFSFYSNSIQSLSSSLGDIGNLTNNNEFIA